MKPIRNLLIGVFFSGGLILAHAQETATTAQSGMTSTGNANTNLAAEIQAIEQIAPIPASEAPLFGTFWSAQHSQASAEPWPPFPADFYQVPVWNLGEGFYLLDDVDTSYQVQSQVQSATGMQAMDEDGIQPPGGGGSGGNPIGPITGAGGTGYTTNDLWLQFYGTASNVSPNDTAYLGILIPSNPTNDFVANGVYDVFATTNLVPSAWQWLMRTTAGETNLTITGLPGPNEFFILGTMQLANDGSGLTVAYENLVGNTFSSDGYGTPNAWYLENGINPLSPGVATQDSDQDGLLNWQKYLYGSNPDVSEGFAVWVGTPNGTSSIP
jgi:hypothetical protein